MRIPLTLLAIYLLPQLACAQAREFTAPFDGAEDIIIFSPDSGSVALERMVELLRRTGFELDTVVTGFAQTSFVPIAAAYESAVPATVAATVRVRRASSGSVLYLYGDCLADSRVPVASSRDEEGMVKTELARYAGARRGARSGCCAARRWLIPTGKSSTGGRGGMGIERANRSRQPRPMSNGKPGGTKLNALWSVGLEVS